jgi:UDPglucose 6-dehydrogenase
MRLTQCCKRGKLRLQFVIFRPMQVTVVGAGYVGLVTSACLAYFDNKVTAVDVDAQRVAELKLGHVPFFEPHLEELVQLAVKNKNLEFSSDISDSVRQADVIFIAVGTPPLSTGEPDMSAVRSVAHAVGAALAESVESKISKTQVIVNKSTVPVGSGNWVEMLIGEGTRNSKATQPSIAAQAAVGAASSRHSGGVAVEIPATDYKRSFAVVSNPEFLREGSAIFDTLYPDRIVIGGGDEEAIARMKELYQPILEQSFAPPEFTHRPEGLDSVPLVVTDLPSAEMIKYAANAFLAMKISFANEMAGLCEKTGADVKQVMRGIGLDERIGSKFLNAGIGWGGSCFGKDLMGLIHTASEYNYHPPLLEAVIEVNQRQRLVPINKLQEELKIIKGRTVGLLGLAFKPNTDDLRDAPSITVATQLIKMGARVVAYDPVCNAVCAALYGDLGIVYYENIEDMASEADALVLVTEWDEFAKADWHSIAKKMRRPIFIDGRNYLSKQAMLDAGFVYRGIGC